MRVLSLAAAALSAASVVSAVDLPTITAVGNKFFDSNGVQFFLKGVAYQLTPDDPLIDGDQCALDAALMKTLGANSIRVYHVDPTADHSDCMAEFANAGIYVLIDLDTFDSFILSTPTGTPQWTKTQYNKYAAVLDAFAPYDNVLGFFVGNEVIAQADQSLAAPYIKAAARDMKAYRDGRKYRKIPIGYSAADIAELRPMLQDYLTCGGDPSVNIDFFSLNSYEWCGQTTYEESGYINLETMAANFPVPVFFSETGCNAVTPRTFDDQDAIFGPKMVKDWSGSIVYEWIQEANNYGLITYDGGANGTPKPLLPDFDNLKSHWATLTPSPVALSAYNPKSVSTRACPKSTAGGWLVDGNVPLPTVGASFISPASTTKADLTVTRSHKAGATAVDTSSPTSTAEATKGSGGGSGNSSGGSGSGSGNSNDGDSNSSSASANASGMSAMNAAAAAGPLAMSACAGAILLIAAWL